MTSTCYRHRCMGAESIVEMRASDFGSRMTENIEKPMCCLTLLTLCSLLCFCYSLTQTGGLQ